MQNVTCALIVNVDARLNISGVLAPKAALLLLTLHNTYQMLPVQYEPIFDHD